MGAITIKNTCWLSLLYQHVSFPSNIIFSENDTIAYIPKETWGLGKKSQFPEPPSKFGGLLGTSDTVRTTPPTGGTPVIETERRFLP